MNWWYLIALFTLLMFNTLAGRCLSMVSHPPHLGNKDTDFLYDGHNLTRAMPSSLFPYPAAVAQHGTIYEVPGTGFYPYSFPLPPLPSWGPTFAVLVGATRATKLWLAARQVDGSGGREAVGVVPSAWYTGQCCTYGFPPTTTVCLPGGWLQLGSTY